MSSTDVKSPPSWARRLGRLAYAGAAVAALAVLVALGAGLGNRLDWWDYRMALGTLRFAVWGGLAGAALAAIGLAAARGSPARLRVIGASGVIAAALLFAVPWWHRQQHAPPINDITTDTADPPQFVAVLPLRKAAPNPAQYGGPAVAEQQKKAYPDIAPAMLAAKPADAFERCLAAARAMGWEIVASAPAEGRIEAIDTTLFMGFKDDIIIRVVPAGAGSRVDVRSKSRVGRGDLGANARRVRAFLKRLSGA